MMLAAGMLLDAAGGGGGRVGPGDGDDRAAHQGVTPAKNEVVKDRLKIHFTARLFGVSRKSPWNSVIAARSIFLLEVTKF